MKRLFLLSAIIMLLGVTANAQQIVYNFNDGSWGEPVTDRPVSGSYTNSTVNEVIFTKAMLYQKEGKGQSRILIDKSSQKGAIEFPEFAAGKKEVIIDASVGTEGKTIILEEKKNGKWVSLGETELTKSKATYTLKISDKATQIRIKNATSSSVSVYKVTIK